MKDNAQGRIRLIGLSAGAAWIGLVVWMVLVLWPYALFAEDSLRLFSPKDLMAIRQIADPQVSSDGRRIAFSVGTPDLTANRIQRTVYLGDLTGGVLKAVTAKDVQAENPRWSPNGRFLYYLAAASSGIRQVWRMSPDDGRPEPVTALPLPVKNFEPGSDGRFLILSMAVFPGKTPHESAALFQDKPKGQGSGRTYDRLMIRHWRRLA